MGRKHTWQGLAQDLGTALVPGDKYRLVADISVGVPGASGSADVVATIALTSHDASGKESIQYINLGRYPALTSTVDAGRLVQLGMVAICSSDVTTLLRARPWQLPGRLAGRLYWLSLLCPCQPP